MLMALGQFIFSLPTLAYDSLQRSTAWRHPSNSRVGARSAHQFVGPGDESIHLSGVLMPALIGRAASLDELREMGHTGQAWPLVAGTGEVFGAYVIENMEETGTYHIDNGSARRIEFSIQLKRVDDEQSGQRVAVGTLGEFKAEGNESVAELLDEENDDDRGGFDGDVF